MKRKDQNILMIVSVAVVIIAVAAFTLLSDDKGGAQEEADHVTFYFYDNHENDDIMGIQAENRSIANGIWVKGYGDTKIDCFMDACDILGWNVEVSDDGVITTWNGITDGNFYQAGWIYKGWSSVITLTSDETYPIRFMAIGHGVASASEGTLKPLNRLSPDDIKWYYGESARPGAGTVIGFYFYDNFENDPASPDASSDITKFVADGYWVTGYGSSVANAFKDACARLGKHVGYDDATGEIIRIGDVNHDLHSLLWDGSGWSKCNMSSVTMNSNMYIAIGYGPASSTGNAPTPWDTPNDIEWSL